MVGFDGGFCCALLFLTCSREVYSKRNKKKHQILIDEEHQPNQLDFSSSSIEGRCKVGQIEHRDSSIHGRCQAALLDLGQKSDETMGFFGFSQDLPQLPEEAQLELIGKYGLDMFGHGKHI